MFRAVRWLRGSGNRLFTMTTGTHDSAPAATAAIVVATGTAAATAAIPTTNTATATTSTSSNGTSDGPTPADVPSPVALPRVPIPPRGVDYRGKVVLAPMVRSGELPMRLMALHYGADLVWGMSSASRFHCYLFIYIYI
jgi:tRNA-dihydrouridine synthase